MKDDKAKISPLYEVETKHKFTGEMGVFVGKLFSAGFKDMGHHREIDTYYSRNDIDYMETVECLRVRQSDEKSEITYKPPTTEQSTTIAKPETNVVLMNPGSADDANRLLEGIGMKKLIVVDKQRQIYTTRRDEETITVAIDMIEGIGRFVEIEIMSTNKQRAIQTIQQLEGELGVSNMPTVRLPYRDIVMQAVSHYE